jgi:hypothetical protein
MFMFRLFAALPLSVTEHSSGSEIFCNQCSRQFVRSETNLFTNTGLRIAFQIVNNIQKILQVRSYNVDCANGGIGSLKFLDCKKLYVGHGQVSENELKWVGYCVKP